ncbi:MAG: AMP-binding protein [Elusimicrobia bacterium]|nr:AMP-binding protein [Elusimicrobiota bacterium]
MPSGKTFFDPWEGAGESRRRRVIRERLADYVRYARGRVPFYRDRLAGFRPRAEHPLAGVPVLESAELRKLLPPLNTRLVADRSSGWTVFQSGGTTGSPKTALFSHAEMEALYLPNARGFHAAGLRRGDRVANLFAVGGLYMTFLHIHRALERFGCANFPFSNHTAPDYVHGCARRFGINCMTGIASVTLDCLRGMEALGLKGIRIEKLYYGGEHLYDSDKAELRERFGVREIAAPGYGTVDTWYIGYQCSACPTGVFHAHDDQCHIEIFDESEGRYCAPGSAGMLYATALPRRLTPIVRYRVGDRARWLGRPCPCGRTTPLFELLGRGDDVLRVGFDSVDYGSIQACVKRVAGLLGSAQMQKYRESGRDRLVVRVETRAPIRARPALAARLAAAILARRPTLSRAVAQKSVWPVRVELLDAGRLPRNPRTGKLVRVVDDR